jgi:hypothetical protein
MNAFWARLLACERKIERYRGMILDLRRQIRHLQQQLRDLRGT